MSDPSTLCLETIMAPPTSCGVRAVGLRVTTLTLGCSAYSCDLGVCCISLRASDTFPKIVVMRLIFFPACDISVLAEGSMAAKNYTNNKEQHVYISIYMHHLHYILVIPFFNQCSNSEVSMWISYFLFYTYKHFCIIRTCRYIQYTNIPTVFIEFYFKSMEKKVCNNNSSFYVK